MAIQTFADGSTYDSLTGKTTPATKSQAYTPPSATNQGLQGFTNTDPSLQNRIAQMQQQVYQQSTVPQLAQQVQVPTIPAGSPQNVQQFAPNSAYPGGQYYYSPTQPPVVPNVAGGSGGTQGGAGGAAGASGATGGAGTGSLGVGGFGSNMAFGAAFGRLMAKAQTSQALQDQRNLLINQLYDRQLTPQEISTLGPAAQQAVLNRDKSLIEFQISSLNDIIKGRADENTTALNYLLQGYQQDQTDAQTKANEAQARADAAMNNVAAIINKSPDLLAKLSPEDQTVYATGVGQYSPQAIATIGNAYKDTLQGLKLQASAAGVKWARVGTDVMGNPQYGWVDAQNRTVSGVSNSPTPDLPIPTDTTTQGGGQNVTIGQFNTPEDIQQWIDTTNPGSPVTSDEITKASQQYGVPWEILAAVMKQESQMGTQMKSKNNPGNVGNDDTGKVVNYNSMQDGINAMAKKIAASEIHGPPSKYSDPTKVITVGGHTYDFSSAGPSKVYATDPNWGKSISSILGTTAGQQITPTTPPVVGTPLPDKTMEQAAQDLAAGRVDPSKYSGSGRSPKTANYNNQIVQRAEQISGGKFNIASASGQYKYATNNQTQQAIVTINTVMPNIDKIVGLSDAFQRGDFPAVNRVLRSIGYNVGSPDITNLNELQNIISDELGKALAGNASLSDAKLNQASNAVDTAQNPQQFFSSMGILKEALINRKKAIYGQAGIYANSLGADGDPDVTSSGATPPMDVPSATQANSQDRLGIL